MARRSTHLRHRAIAALHRGPSTIRDAALEWIAAGPAAKELLVSGPLAHISDVRAYRAEMERAQTGRIEARGSGRAPSR
jgi:hypothetical protein